MADLIVVGAGISGIAAARFYLEIHPEHQVVLLERDVCAGGVWNSRRLYEGFWTQWTVGTGEFSDIRMPRPPEEDIYYEFFKSKYTTQYLEDYIDRHEYAGQSLHERIRFGFRVQSVKKDNEAWIISGEEHAGQTVTLRASKVIVATGLTSTPNMPVLNGREKFDAPIVHQEDFGQTAMLSSMEIKNVAVLGGGNSAADMAYAAAKAGKSVSWIIRKSGTGPGYLLAPKGKWPYKNAFELANIRVAETITPSVINPDTWWSRFLHGTELGRKLVQSAWASADAECIRDADFERKDAKGGFEHLKPISSLFWQNNTGGLINRADFWDVVAQNVRIYYEDVLELDTHLIRLKDGLEISTDLLLCGTGWDDASFPFFDTETAVQLGIPHAFGAEPLEDEEHWSGLVNAADKEIVHRFPTLANPPEHARRRPQTTPYRLYNFIAPVHDDTIAFIGYAICSNHFKAVECQAIWATAFLDHQLKLPSVEDQQLDIAQLIAGCRRRYLSNGELGIFLLFESISYTDMLLQELGLSSHRRGFLKDYFVPADSQDFVGLKDEYIAKYGRDKPKST